MVKKSAMPLLIALAGACSGPSAVETGNKESEAVPGTLAADAKKGPPVRCPVCGLEFGAAEAQATYRHENKPYYFLLEDHKDAFAASPDRYLSRQAE